MSGEAWKTLFRDFLGSKGPQYCDEVWPLLVAVDQGIKPSLLWDVCTPDTNALLSLLNAALERQLLTEKLRVVEIDLDVFILNINALVRMLMNILTSEESWLVDISEAEPKIPSKETHYLFRNHLISLLSQLGISDEKFKSSDSKPNDNEQVSIPTNDVSSSGNCISDASKSEATQSNSLSSLKAITIHLPNDLNLSTVFGCMLGYPQVYWWQGDKGGNSLSGVPLKVFKFGAHFNPSSSFIELFSFSIPEPLETELRPGIERWGNILNILVEKSLPFSETKFTCDSVLCLSVAL